MAVDYDGYGEDDGDAYSRSSSKRFCGRMLTESLALICDGQYGTIIPTEKRSGSTHLKQFLFTIQSILYEQLTNHFVFFPGDGFQFHFKQTKNVIETQMNLLLNIHIMINQPQKMYRFSINHFHF